MDRQLFESELKRDGFEIATNTTVGAKVNREHSHPFDVRAMVLDGALTLTSEGKTTTYRAGEWPVSSTRTRRPVLMSCTGAVSRIPAFELPPGSISPASAGTALRSGKSLW